MPTIAHISAHPDDCALGAPMTLARLKAAGWTVVDVLVSQGRAGDHERRLAEWQQYLRRTKFEGAAFDPPLAISSTDDPQASEADVSKGLASAFASIKPDVVMSPHIHDRQAGHELVARAVKSLQPRIWWMYGLWSGLQTPNVFASFGPRDLNAAVHALEAFEGELERSDFISMLRGRSLANVAMRSDTVGNDFAAESNSDEFAELLMEVVCIGGQFRFGERRELDVADYARPPSEIDVSSILDQPSSRDLLTRLQRG